MYNIYNLIRILIKIRRYLKMGEKAKVEKKKKEQKKTNIIKLTTKPMTEEELENKLRLEFGNNNMYYKTLKKIVDKITEKYRQRLKKSLLILREEIKPSISKDDNGKSSIKFNKNLTDDELSNYIILITTEMYFLSNAMEDFALDMEVANYLKEFSITENILEITGGTAQERARVAEYNNMQKVFHCIIKSRVFYNIKNEIDQANKVYEALKKVLTARIEEKKARRQ
jgi:hypothetical protein